MYTILEKKALNDNTDLMIIQAPEIAQKAKAGEFILIRANEFSERIPLTIADFDKTNGTISVIFQKVGKSTSELGELSAGDQVRNFVGPLGKASEIKNYGTVICVGGGVGIAPIYPITKALHEAGNKVIAIIGARTANLIFWKEKMQEVCDELIICTDDGSTGIKGQVTGPLKRILENNQDIARVWAIGPAVMMKFCSKTTEEFNVPTVVSLDSIMIDGTGMCGACRVQIGSETKFVCVDGPEFDGHLVNWDVVLSRKRMFIQEEQEAKTRWLTSHKEAHICNLTQKITAQEKAVRQQRESLVTGE